MSDSEPDLASAARALGEAVRQCLGWGLVSFQHPPTQKCGCTGCVARAALATFDAALERHEADRGEPLGYVLAYHEKDADPDKRLIMFRSRESAEQACCQWNSTRHGDFASVLTVYLGAPPVDAELRRLRDRVVLADALIHAIDAAKTAAEDEDFPKQAVGDDTKDAYYDGWTDFAFEIRDELAAYRASGGASAVHADDATEGEPPCSS